MIWRALLCLLLTSCTLAHEQAAPFPVDVSGYSACELEAVEQAADYWELAVGEELFGLGDHGARVELYDYAECPYYLSVAHELGHVMGLPDDELPASLMNPGPWPNSLILPVHVGRVREVTR